MNLNLALGIGALLFAASAVWLVVRSERLLAQKGKILFRRVVENRFTRAGSCVVCCVVAVHLLLGFIACPWLLASENGPNGSWHRSYSTRTAVLIEMVEWGIVTIGLTFAASRVSLTYLMPLALVTVLIVAVGVFVVLKSLGALEHW